MRYLVLSIYLLVLVSCKTDEKPEFSLNGSITELKDFSMFYLRDAETGKDIDSSKVVENSFKFTTNDYFATHF